MSLIGCRCKHGNMFSRAVLIGLEACTLLLTMIMTGQSDVLHGCEGTGNAGGLGLGVTHPSLPNTVVKP
jgi:hypothetical protein